MEKGGKGRLKTREKHGRPQKRLQGGQTGLGALKPLYEWDPWSSYCRFVESPTYPRWFARIVRDKFAIQHTVVIFGSRVWFSGTANSTVSFKFTSNQPLLPWQQNLRQNRQGRRKRYGRYGGRHTNPKFGMATPYQSKVKRRTCLSFVTSHG